MSMEVSFTIHSHIIGRGGQNINAVMKETKTKIHFPDGNRIAGEKKSNTGYAIPTQLHDNNDQNIHCSMFHSSFQ